MKLVLGLSKVTDDDLKYCAQLGIDGLISGPSGYDLEKGYYDFVTMVNLRTRIEGYGLTLDSIHMVPWEWTIKCMLNLPGRDEQIENFHRTLRSMGAAGIPILGYNWHAMRFYRTSRHTPERAGSLATSFDLKLAENAPLMSVGPGINTELIPASHRRPYTDDELWANLEYFVKAVVPVAEEAGVKLALHPDDPPVPAIGGVARIIRSPEAYRRVFKMVDSPYHGMVFCQGCFAEMDSDVLKEIRYFGSQKKMFIVHFRNIAGNNSSFHETFPDNGKVNMIEAMKAYKESGFDGLMTPDHAIHMVGDTEWGHRYWAYAVGHMKALAAAV